ncbi:hypothetical protein [Anaerocolumna sp.]|uniref:hypothetical protein n=1 Tax=Anaerocolumna sp. TaxID=2041569 RepID=UPI0028AEF2DA|nr:hypothetical protein [Anaerocolumna sp.]
MGQNYASFHIIAEDTKETQKQLEQYFSNNTTSNNISNIREGLTESIDDEYINNKFSLFSFLQDLFENTPKLILINNNKFISVYDESYSLENMETEGINLSKYLETPVIGTGNLDDDVFSILLFHKGKIITRYTMGEGLEKYEFKLCNMDLELFKNVTNLSVEKLDALLKEEDIYDIEDGFSELYNIALDLTYDDLASFENKFKKLKETNSYSIFELLVTS